MKVLIIGGGGREHALAWKAAQSADVTQVYCAPGNAGTAKEPGVKNVAIGAEDLPNLLNFAKDNAINLTIVGPEAPLVAGIVDQFTAAELNCFGPGSAAAQLEGSKAFSKDFLAKHGIPTAAYGTFTEIDPAIAFIHDNGAPIVVKADGLAAGKGVIVAQTEAEAEAAVRDMLADNAFGEAGSRVVIENFLTGEEASFICICDGDTALPMATSQDHKAAHDGDTGPNTGGMGAYSPAPVVTPELHKRVMDEVINPTLRGMEEDGHPYTGFLYAGLMIGQNGSIKVLEFNCRFGDPETQPIMMRLQSDLTELCLAAIENRLHECETKWDERPTLGVVMAAGGYPGSYSGGDVISGLDEADSDDVKVFHAGTKAQGDNVVTSGGRVLCVTALGNDIADAQAKAYERAAKISWDNSWHRNDIGHRAVG